MAEDDRIAATIRMLLAARDGSICPSETARALASDWRPLMAEVRRVAAGLPDVKATQGGQPVDPVSARGPIRLERA